MRRNTKRDIPKLVRAEMYCEPHFYNLLKHASEARGVSMSNLMQTLIREGWKVSMGRVCDCCQEEIDESKGISWWYTDEENRCAETCKYLCAACRKALIRLDAEEPAHVSGKGPLGRWVKNQSEKGRKELDRLDAEEREGESTTREPKE